MAEITTSMQRELPGAHGRAVRAPRRRGWGAAAVATSLAGALSACAAGDPPVTAQRSVVLTGSEDEAERDGSRDPSSVSDVGAGDGAEGSAGRSDPESTSTSTTAPAPTAPPPGGSRPAVTLPADVAPATLPTVLLPPTRPERRSLSEVIITVDDLPDGWTLMTGDFFRPRSSPASSGMASLAWPGARATQDSSVDCFVAAQVGVIPEISFQEEATFSAPPTGLDPGYGTWLNFRIGRTAGVVDAELLEQQVLECNGAPVPQERGGGTYSIIQLPPMAIGDASMSVFMQVRGGYYESDRVTAIVQMGDIVFTGLYYTNVTKDLTDVHLLDHGLRTMLARLGSQ